MNNSVFLRNPSEISRSREKINLSTYDNRIENSTVVDDKENATIIDDKEISTMVQIMGYDQDYTKKEDEILFGSSDYSGIDYTVGDDENSNTYA